MKVITIGRDDSCDILLDDPNISRRHAVLRLHPTGRIEIIDYSRNGTSVNGIRLGNEKLTRITRKDSITFAGVKSLDWSKIPDPSRPVRLAVIIACAVVAIGVLAVVGISVYRSGQAYTPGENTTVTDTVTTAPQYPDAEAPAPESDGTGTAEPGDADVQGDLPVTNPNAPKATPKANKRAGASKDAGKGSGAKAGKDGGAKAGKSDGEKGGSADNGKTSPAETNPGNNSGGSADNNTKRKRF